MTEAMIDSLPDPEKFRDAMFLADHPGWTARDLDETDAELLGLLQRIQRK